MKLFKSGVSVVALAITFGCSQQRAMLNRVSPSVSPPMQESPTLTRSKELYSQAHEYRKKGDTKAYVSALAESYDLVPENQGVGAELAEVYYDQGEFDKALPILRKIADTTDNVVSTEERNPVVLAELGELELRAGNADAARKDFTRATQTRGVWEKSVGDIPLPTFGNQGDDLRASAHFVAGLKNQANGKPEEALREYSQASKLKPADYEVKLTEARCLENAQPPRPEEALAIYRSICLGAKGQTGALATKAKERLEYYWKTRHTWAPFDQKTNKPMAWNDKSKRYELPAEKK